MRITPPFKGIIFFIIFLMLSLSAFAQTQTPILDFKTYQIVGKDTSVFTIIGERISTVALTIFPIETLQIERRMESSLGLLSEDETIRRVEQRVVRYEPYSIAEIDIGSRTLMNMQGKVSSGKVSQAQTFSISNCTTKENTPTNSAPYTQDIGAIGSWETSIGHLSTAFNLSGQTDNLFGESFRSRERKAQIYSSDVVMMSRPVKQWDMKSVIHMHGGRYESRDNTLTFDKREVVLDGIISARRDIYDFTTVIASSAHFLETGSDRGSLVTLGAKGSGLLLDTISIQPGITFFSPKMPGHKRKTKIYPELTVETKFSSTTFMTLSYKPEYVSHSFKDLYAMNGLITDTIPFLLENKERNISGLVGWNIHPHWAVTGKLFYCISTNSPFFSRSGKYFDVILDRETKIKGIRLSSTFERTTSFGISGEISFQDATVSHGRDVPFIPPMEAHVRGFMVPHDQWTMYSAVAVYSKRHIDVTSDDTVDSFATVDIGVQKDLSNKICIYSELRNILNAKGAWWTNDYQVPGISFYAGLRTINPLQILQGRK